MHRTNGTITNLMKSHGVTSWDMLIHRACFRWGGKLVDISKRDPTRLTSTISQYRDCKWMQTVAKANNTRQLHGRKLRTWRWERLFYTYFGDDWKLQYQDEAQWRDIESDFMQWRVLNR